MITPELLTEAEQAHAEAEKRLPKHAWQVFYSAYMVERLCAHSPEDSAATAEAKVRATVWP